MADIDRLSINNQIFMSTMLGINARKHRIAATAMGQMQITGIARQLLRELGGDEDICDEYYLKVLKSQPANKPNPLSARLSEFLRRYVSPGLIHKYNLKTSDIRFKWNFDSLDDTSEIDHISNSSVNCEHHDRWKKEQAQAASELKRQQEEKEQSEAPDLSDVDDPKTPIDIFKDANFPHLAKKKEEIEEDPNAVPGQAFLTRPAITRAKKASKAELDRLMEL